MRIVLYAAAAIVATILGVSLSLLVFGPPKGGAVGGSLAGVGEAAIGGPFELIDHNGGATDETVLLGQPTLVYFGYTYCPDFCPTELANMAAAAELVAQDGGDLGLVFVTVDPERDTSDVLKEYVGLFHDDFTGLTGTVEQIADIARAYKVIYRKSESPDYDDYLVDHTTFLYLMDSNGKYVTFFRAAEDPANIAEAVTKSSGRS